MGTRRLLDLAGDTAAVELRDTRYTHDPAVLAAQHRLVAINSAIEVDLTGQVNSETAAGRYVGAVGGATDFLRGAARSEGGIPVIALPSTASPGAGGAASRIVARLSGPASQARADAGVVVTEYGVADLRGCTLAQRRERMLAIAHPDSQAGAAARTTGGSIHDHRAEPRSSHRCAPPWAPSAAACATCRSRCWPPPSSRRYWPAPAIDPELIDDVSFAQSYASGETPCIGRWAALQAGLPVSVPGFQLDRRCGGGLQAIVTAAMMVQTGAADVVLAGGVESMSNVEHYTTSMRWGARPGNQFLYDRLDRGRERSQPEWRFGKISGMIETAENLAEQFGITRDEADAYAARSHQRAAAAWDAGLFDDEVVPVEVPQRRGEPVTVSRDEGVRPDSTPESLSKLRTIMPGGTVTAGNASQQNDAAAACLVVAEDKLAELGLEPLGYLVGWAAAGCEPATMGIGPVPAVARLFARTGLDFGAIDLVELNEAFAAQVLAVLAGWGWNDPDKLNVNGSGISLGHPIGATGARMLATGLRELPPARRPLPAGDHVRRRRPGRRGDLRGRALGQLQVP